MATSKNNRFRKTPEKKYAGFTAKELKLFAITFIVFALAFAALFIVPRMMRDRRNNDVLKNAPENMLMCNTGTKDNKNYVGLATVDAIDGYALTEKTGTIADDAVKIFHYAPEVEDAAAQTYSVRTCKDTAENLINGVRDTYGGYLSDIISEGEIAFEEMDEKPAYTYIIRYRDPDSILEKAFMYVDVGAVGKLCVGVSIENAYADEASIKEDGALLDTLRKIAARIKPVQA